MAVTVALAVVFAATASALLAGGRPNPLRTRLGQHERNSRWRVSLPGPVSRRRAAVAREGDVAEACLALGAELHAGAPVPKALTTVAAEWPDLFGPVARAASVGGDVAAMLRDTARLPGAGALVAVSAGWEVTERTGAPLSRVVVAVADALRVEAAVRREAQSQLATARTTARLLAVLPVVTLVLLSGGEGAAVEFLVSSTHGRVCLAGAIGFVLTGLWWVDRLARSATRSTWGR